MIEEYIQINKKINNYKLLVIATERFSQLMYFLESEREYKGMSLKIGSFEYDDWKADIYCILDEYGVRFKHIRDFDKKSWSHKTLTEQLIYAWGFEEIDFKIDFNIINDFWNILNTEDKDIYDSLYDEVHCEFW